MDLNNELNLMNLTSAHNSSSNVLVMMIHQISLLRRGVLLKQLDL